VRRAFSVALGLLATAGVTATAAAPHARGNPPRLRTLRVCAYEHYSLALSACTADQRDRPLLSTRIVCSVRYSTPRPAVLRMRWTYAGHPVVTFSRTVAGVGGYVLKFDTGGPTMPLPGGAYVCTFTLGSAHTQATLLSSGPTGDVVDIEICTVENAFKYGTFPVCKSDQSAAPIVGGSAIVCDGVLPNATGTDVALRFTDSDGTVVSQARTTTISAPMRQNYASVATSALHPGTTYACQFTFSGAVVAEQQFAIAP
jgi:hypothetical protein